MTVFVNDTFTDTNATLLESHTGETGATWTEHGSSEASNDFRIFNNGIRAEGTGSALYYASGTPSDADYDVEAELLVDSVVNSVLYLCGRLATGADTYYYFGRDQFAAAWVLGKVVAGTETALDTTGSVSVSNSVTYDLKLEMRGTTIKGYLDGVEVCSATDSAISAAGKAGVTKFGDVSDGTGFRLLSITGTDTSSGGSVPENSVAPAITGTETEGENLTSTAGTWSESPTEYDYLWQRADDGAFTTNVETIQTHSNDADTTDVYTLVSGDVAHYIRCTVTATNATGDSDPEESNIVGPIAAAPAAPANTVPPAVTGNKYRTQTLTTDDGTWTGDPTIVFTYQWQRDNSGGGSYSNIGGATANTRVLDANDVGCQVRCVVTGTNSSGNASANSNATVVGELYTGPPASTGRVEVCGNAVVVFDPGTVSDPPANTTAPVVSGSLIEGATLTTTDGDWTNGPITDHAYDWERADDEAFTTNVTNIGTDQNTYVVVAADEDKWIRCQVTATNSFGASDPEPSAAVEIDTPVPTNSVAPAVTGTVRVNQELSCTTGTWANSPTSYAYQWEQADDLAFVTNVADITGETSATVTLTVDELDLYIRCQVTATNAGGAGAETASNIVGPVTEALDFGAAGTRMMTGYG